MEGLTMSPDGKLHGFLQSPIDPLDSAGASVKATDAADSDQDGSKTDSVNIRDFAQFARWMAFDPMTEKSKLYAYPLSYPLSSAGEKWGSQPDWQRQTGGCRCAGKWKIYRH
jgi:hypothetical protein